MVCVRGIWSMRIRSTYMLEFVPFLLFDSGRSNYVYLDG